MAPLVFADPAIRDFEDRHRVEEMQLLAATPDDGDQVRIFQQFQMLGHRLPSHVQVFTKLSECLAILCEEFIEQLPARRVGECFEHLVHSLIHADYYATKWLHVKNECCNLSRRFLGSLC